MLAEMNSCPLLPPLLIRTVARCAFRPAEVRDCIISNILMTYNAAINSIDAMKQLINDSIQLSESTILSLNSEQSTSIAVLCNYRTIQNIPT